MKRKRNNRGRLENNAPNPIDRHVGERVRLRRLALGLSQQQLAAKLGVSFQQLLKI